MQVDGCLLPSEEGGRGIVGTTECSRDDGPMGPQVASLSLVRGRGSGIRTHSPRHGKTELASGGN